jgi:hypothetical protein
MKPVQTESVNGIRTFKAQVVPAFPVAVVTSLFTSKLPQRALARGRPGAFFEGHGQSSTQSRQELKNGCEFGFPDGFHALRRASRARARAWCRVRRAG